MKFQRQPVEEVNVNLTSLIDVVFLLLIFFMVSTTFTRERELTVELPEAVAEGAAEAAEFIEIEVNAEGEYAVNKQLLVNRDRETLAKALKDQSKGNFDLPMIITADANATHQAVMTAMDVSGELGFTKLRLTAQQPEQ
ncbi:ExbD/TolR family protein [Ketobacter alkanivorans]|uniref:Biopolymer transporter ExbD n=1 Tax=Ketobacter alkanivorans TaxID=1917421 RepID=A0A2K9LUU4_9GAMM|nr:biopolymer transporter ExbD [Ketobacter alkanivorans]AUM14614.1 biopolymer transporter ExbD [Ketobacter alkanivorans]MCP5013915.1 biopolymer transporter ExbD [Ketobacter sp.]